MQHELEARPFQRIDGSRGHFVVINGEERVFIELGKDFRVSPIYYEDLIIDGNTISHDVREDYRKLLESPDRPKRKSPKRKRVLPEKETIALRELTYAIRRLVVQEALEDGRFARLNSREQQVLASRYLFEGEGKTPEEVGDNLGYSTRYIYFIEKRALRKIAKLRVDEPRISIGTVVSIDKNLVGLTLKKEPFVIDKLELNPDLKDMVDENPQTLEAPHISERLQALQGQLGQ